MKINTYVFPDGVDPHTRYLEGAEAYAGTGNRETGRCTESDTEVLGITVTKVKQLIKKYGGHGFTQHIDRDGGLFDTTEIKLKGNNSKHKYNRHL